MNEIADRALGPHLHQAQKMADAADRALGPHLRQAQKMADAADRALGPHLRQAQKMADAADRALGPHLRQAQKMADAADRALGPHLRQAQKMADAADRALGPHLRQAQKMADAFLVLINSIPPEFFEGLSSVQWVPFDAKAEKIMHATGWLPYPGVETYLKDVGKNMELASLRCEEFVDREWSWIRQDMEEQLNLSTVDEETKETFRECLANFEDARYRCICRCLMPEIERALRIKIDKMTGKVNITRDLGTYASQDTTNGMSASNYYEFLHFEVFFGPVQASVN